MLWRAGGTPEEIAAGFLKSLPDEELNEQLHLRKRVLTFVRTIVAALAIVLLLLFGYHVYDVYSYTHGETLYSSPTEAAPTPESNSYEVY